MSVSPSIQNYYIGKGELYFTEEGTSAMRHLGNVPEFEMTPEVEKLPHNSSMAGVKSEDHNVVLTKKVTIRIVMEEWTAQNMAMVMLSTVTQNTAGNDEFEIFADSEVKGQIEFIGANDVGPKINVTLPSVSLTPSGSLSLISDEWGSMEATGDVNFVGGTFGTVEEIAA